MFIIKLGAEALNKLEIQLAENCNSSLGIQKSVTGSNLYSCERSLESSILYNLLSTNESPTVKPQSLLFPNSLISYFDGNIPPRANTISYPNQSYSDPLKNIKRPYSAPQSYSEINLEKTRKRKQHTHIPSDMDELRVTTFRKHCKISSKSSVNSQQMINSSDSYRDEPMNLSKTAFHESNGKCIVDSWLFQIVSLINSTHKQFGSSLVDLPPSIRLHLLLSSWHRIIVTYLFEHVVKFPSSISIELWKFLQSVTGITDQSVLSRKKMSCMCKNLADELSVILFQIRKLNLDDVSMNFLRIGLFLTGNQDENNQKNLKLIELFIQSKIDSSESDLQIVSELIDNFLRLNSVIIETIFYSHLTDSVENFINHLFENS